MYVMLATNNQAQSALLS